ncbi:MAG: type III pantothenate kinase [Bryobacterales bacterium]|nr:type III pantothenate kinase [Bryobacterales bacterium]MBV9399035.1 type III pantothenate kinase [Bryobacterales bacterium]
MLLCIDVGNSQIFGGVYDGDCLKTTFRRTSSVRASSDEFGMFFRSALRENGIDPALIRMAAICSVVPDVVHSLRSCFRKYFGFDPFLLQPGTKTGLKIRYRNPLEVGADKIANAIGAVVRYPDRNLIIVDFGTATTLCAVTRSQEYLGGVILPGIHASMAMLGSKTARLPVVEIARPQQVLGRSAVESIQSGLYYGALETVRALAALIVREQFAEDPPLVIGTGGFGTLFQQERLFDFFVPDLPLIGLRRAVELSTTSRAGSQPEADPA